MKKTALLFLFCFIGIITLKAQEAPIRDCATFEGFYERLEADPAFRQNIEAVERITRIYERKIREEGVLGLRSGVVTIPVVVHVVYANSTENISDAQIQSQIDVLNEDFRRMNADLSTVPGAFSGLPADIRIQFALASRDPDCEPTDGITRTATSVTSFSHSSTASTPTARNPVKFNSSGGADSWPADEYLNMWVCDLSGTTLGYASFPADLAARPDEDGVVIDYEAFGDTGTADPPFDLGRTGTHEIGHWLNLRHIWGDDGPGTPLGPCEGSDMVDDTPNQDDSHSACPSFPQVSCMNGPDGDLYVNFMDYVDDDCMVMFTQGQATRMAGTLFGVRASIVASDALVPPGDAPAPDLWSQDTPDDTGLEPNPSTEPMYQSVDIWVRNTDDGFANQEHQNPVFRASGEPNYVYVRVRNRGCSGSQSGNLRLYWAKAGSGLSWPSPWDGTVTMPALMGDAVGSQSVTVDGGEFEILQFPWVVPNPADYASIGGDESHFCLLSRIETSSTAPFGMTFPETSNLYQNVQNNNNIVWKNVTVATPEDGSRLAASVIVGNFFPEALLTELSFDLPEEEERSIFDFGTLVVDLGDELFEIWSQGNQTGENIEVLGDNQIQLFGPPASLQNIQLPPGALHDIQVFFQPSEQINFNSIFKLDMAQINQETNEIVGGQVFIFKILAGQLLEPAQEAVVTVDCPAAIPQDCKFPVTVSVDMTPVPAPNHRLGNFTAVLNWDPVELALTGPSDILSGYNGFVNLDPVAGTLTFNGANTGGQEGVVDILKTTFEAIGPVGSTSEITVDFVTMAAAGTFTDLSAGATVRACSFPIIPSGILGDVNGDGLVNSTDASVILTHSVGNPVPPDMQARISSGFGDVNTDGVTNPADALIILTYDVGLPVPFALGKNFCPSELQAEEIDIRSPEREAQVSVLQRKKTDGTMEVPVFVDLREYPGLRLGSFSAEVEWNPASLRLVDYEGGSTAGFEAPVVNDTHTASGALTLADAYPVGAEGFVHVFTLEMEVLQPGVDPGLRVNMVSATSAETFERLSGISRYETESLAPGRTGFSLHVQPNPFRQDLRIHYRLESGQFVSLAVYDYTGREITQLVNVDQRAGDHFLYWEGVNRNGERLPGGIYFLRLNAGDRHVTKKLILIRR